MPFNPILPVNNSLVDAAELRAQFNGLKDFIDTQAAQISSLQTELALVPPGVAQINGAHESDPGTLTVSASANRALEVTVFRKGPSDLEFVAMGNILSGDSIEESGLESGMHTVKAVGFNGGGTGQESATVDVTVA
jgi:hypothetical protein